MDDGNGTQNNDLAPTRRDGGPLRASNNLKMTSRRHAVARCRAAARSTSDKLQLQLNVLPQADVP